MRVTIQPGTYYLGDPCYSVPQSMWDGLLAQTDYFNKPVGTVNGHTVIAFHTAYGDGDYPLYDGSARYVGSLPVDAGLIGLVAADLVGPNAPEGTVEVQFGTQTVATWADGDMSFGSYNVDTTDEADEVCASCGSEDHMDGECYDPEFNDDEMEF